MLKREDMMELTRRMNVSRASMDRIAGSYMDEEGYSEGTFNVNFLKLSGSDKAKNLKIARSVLFGETNVQLKDYRFPGSSTRSVQMQRLLLQLRQCSLKNDAMMFTFYDEAAAHFQNFGKPYEVMMFHGVYDIPRKGSDRASQEESEEVYDYLVAAFCPMRGEYEPDEPVCGFLFPSFKDRSEDRDRISVFQKDPARPHSELERDILGIQMGK
jgi:hypothetical protein